MIQVLLVDDHAVVREGYRRLLERENDLRVVGEAADATEGYRAFCRLTPDVVIKLPGGKNVVVDAKVALTAFLDALECDDDTQRAGGFWHTHVREAGRGQLYAYRVHGDGPRFDPSRTLLDPYARMVEGDVLSGGGRCRVVDTVFDWSGDRLPAIPWRDTVLYEAHVRGLTRLHPGVSVSDARAATGWDLRVAATVARTEPPTGTELSALRELLAAS